MNETRNINGRNLSKINHYKICESYTQDICGCIYCGCGPGDSGYFEGIIGTAKTSGVIVTNMNIIVCPGTISN